MPEPFVSVGLFQYSVDPNEGWDHGKFDHAHWDGGLTANQWTDITCDARGIDIQRGQSNVRIGGGVEAGLLHLDLDNRDGQWSQFTVLPGGRYVPALSGGQVIRVVSTLDPAMAEANLTYHFLGWIESWRQEWTEVDDIIHIVAHDGWADLVQQGQGVPWTPGASGETVGVRLVNLLTRGQWPTFHGPAKPGTTLQPKHTLPLPVYLQSGSITCIGSRVIAGVETGITVSSSVADEITRTALSDGGKAFLDANGAFVYLDRTWSLGANQTGGGAIPAIGAYSPSGAPVRPAQASIPLFGDWCATPGATELPYTDLEWVYDSSNPINSLIVANSAPPEVRTDAGVALPQPWRQCGATNSNQYGTPVLSLTDLRFSTSAEASLLVQHYFDAYQTAFIAVSRLSVYPPLDDRLWTTALGLRIGDHITVLRREKMNTLTLEVVIEGVHLTITPEPQRTVGGQHYGQWLYDFTTSEARTMVSAALLAEAPLNEKVSVDAFG